MNIHRILSTLNSFNNLGISTKLEGINRLAFTHNERLAALKFSMYCQELGMHVYFDKIGNVIARKEGKYNDLPAVVIGSHIDTVPEGGQYDGLLGVVGALEVVRHLHDMNIVTDHPIEIIAFSCEESARFNVATVGSKYLCGMLNEEDMKTLKDAEGQTLLDVVQSMTSTDSNHTSNHNNNNMKAFLELHIEQGPILENKQKDIGIVTHIAAPERFKVQLTGTTSHSGSTPMPMRKDAMTCGAEIIVNVESIANQYHQDGIVATVGGVDVTPNTMNAVPGDVTLLIDIRGIDKEVRSTVAHEIKTMIEQITQNRKIDVAIDSLGQDTPVKLSESIANIIEEKAKLQNLNAYKMFSGAGHDAMNMANFCPTSMIFIPCKDGISHSPKESVTTEQIENGISLLIDTAIDLASSSTKL
ncbi:M20 family metallo-hydrolase [Staphylococcus sp. 17KM0847]|uniref:M20 family metallo-hydrolase n=1 Tax=Staphylococcus sp. 17KM0847 TaxID=2583989 RepID=UPI0015DC3ACC|nr:M20 family metallo-hydrolase [Staphylococcus sp. 17KM0847]QLK85373.1 M20 family metallo-hydrolase [Staphylococcus sp. 17KM0847]